MINHSVNVVTLAEMEELLKELRQDDSLHIAEFQGSEIKNYRSFEDTMWETLQFPLPQYKNFDGYSDWIRDLSWLEKEGYVLVIYDYDDFLSEDKQAKTDIVFHFINRILIWWKRDVEKCVVEGRTKPFNIYLVI